MCPPTKSSQLKHQTNSNTTTSMSSLPKSVKFDQVFIHEFPVILGDNPAVSRGAPLTIDWKPMAHDVIDVDIYEYLRGPERRHRKRMILSVNKRAKMLMHAGFSIDDIAEITLQVEEDKRIRAEHALEATSAASNTPLSALKALNTNIMELITGAAEGTGRTLFVSVNATGQALGTVGKGVVKGTGKVVVGTGRLGYDVVVGTGKVASDVVVGTGKVATDVVVGTGKVATDVVVGTVKGTGKVVVGTGKVGMDVVVGTGKLVASTGKRVSKMVGLGESNNRLEYGDDEEEEDYGYEDARPSSDYLGSSPPQYAHQYAPRRLFSRRTSAESQAASRRGSNDTAGSMMSVSRRGSAEQPRRGSADGSATTKPYHPKPRRRGSGNNALASFTQSFLGRGVQRSESSKGKLQGGNRRTKSGSAGDGGRRRASMAASPPNSRPSRPHSRSATSAPINGTFSELAQMEQFLNYIQDSDPLTVNPIINNAYNSSSDDLDFDPDIDIDSSGGSMGRVGSANRGSSGRRRKGPRPQ